MLHDRPTRTEIAELLAQAATRPPRRGRRRVGLVAALACVVILVAGGATSVWASGRGAADLSWGEAMVVLRASELGSRRRAALEAIRRHTREAIAIIRELEAGDDAGLREHAHNVLESIHEAAR